MLHLQHVPALCCVKREHCISTSWHTWDGSGCNFVLFIHDSVIRHSRLPQPKLQAWIACSTRHMHPNLWLERSVVRNGLLRTPSGRFFRGIDPVCCGLWHPLAALQDDRQLGQVFGLLRCSHYKWSPKILHVNRRGDDPRHLVSQDEAL